MAQDSKESIAAHNEAIIQNAIGEQLGRLYRPKEPQRMNGDASNGQIHALQSDVNNLKTNFAELKSDMNTMSSNLSNEIKGVRDAVFERFDKFFELQSATRPDIYKTLGSAGVVGTIMLIIIGGFASLAKTNLDTNIAFTNEKIATSSSVVEKNFTATNSSIASIVGIVQHLSDTTIPRLELENRIGRNERIIDSKMDKDVIVEIVKRYDSEIAAINADNIRFKDALVGRPEHEQHWKQYDDRLSLISNRLVELGHLTMGSSALEQIKQLQDQVQALTNKFVVIPGMSEGKH